MRIDALVTALRYFDMCNIFQILPSETITLLEDQFKILFDLQTDIDTEQTKIDADATNTVTAAGCTVVKARFFAATTIVEAITIEPTDLIINVNGVDEAQVRRSNQYYNEYGTEGAVENLAWYDDHILATCDKNLRNKV